MSILESVAGGTILEAPVPNTNLASRGSADELKARILADLLPAQREFVNDESHRILGYIGGFGSGKSYALCAKALFLGMANPGTTAMVAEPSFPMIRTVFMPAMELALEQWKVEFEFRVSPQPEWTLHLPTGDVKLLAVSAENWQKVRGQNISFVLWDECDTSPQDIAAKAGEMFLARMRTGNINQLAVASTPEGFRWAYRTFVEQDGEDKRLIRVKTRDNPNLPSDFVPSLERNYPPQLIQAYLEGEFVNLASCALYPDFDRDQNYSDVDATQQDTIYIGIDLNVGFCATVHMVRRGDEFHIFDERVYRDTAKIAEGLKDLYHWWFQNRQLVLVPDASAKQRSTAAAQASDLGILKQAGHKVTAQQSNPLVQDRINAVNMLIATRRLLVTNKCKNTIRTLEQHAFDEKGKPAKGGIGADDLSHHGDALGYVLYRYAAIRQWTTNPRKAPRVW